MALVELTPEQKFQAAIVRFQDHVELLRTMSKLDLQVLGAFMTLQLGLAGWLSDHVPGSLWSKCSLLILSAIITIVALKVLHNNYARRKEVVASLANVKAFLGFEKEGDYLPERALDTKTSFRPWWPWSIIACCVSFLSVAIIILLLGGLS